MYDRFKNLNSKHQRAILSIIFSLLWLLFGSSVSILSPTSGDLGFLFGSLSALFVLLGPLFYVRVKKIKVKNAKPLLVEPSVWKALPLFFLVSGLFFFLCIAVVGTVSESAIDAIGDETFLSNAVMAFIFLVGMAGPACAYGVYTLTHYKRIIQYGTQEWRKVKVERKLAKRA